MKCLQSTLWLEKLPYQSQHSKCLLLLNLLTSTLLPK
uniref:Uncharacterized protein n=1 Tax=Anguilla anguilla TaxID=7936 RepID=A0A0E9TAD2_ANGAN